MAHVGPVRLDSPVELIRVFTSEQFSHALESWDWIGIGDREPLFTSPFGDVFFRSDDGIWWLDVLEGSLSRPWSDPETLRSDLDTEAGQDRYLLAGLAIGAEQRGVVATGHEVLGFAVAPIIGGPVTVDNIETIDFALSLNILGQIHRQVREMPPGSRVTGFTFDGEPPA